MSEKKLRKIYIDYLTEHREVDAFNIGDLTLAQATAVIHFSKSPSIAYKIGLSALKQLAIYTKLALSGKGVSSHFLIGKEKTTRAQYTTSPLRALASWRYFGAFRFWAQLICENPQNDLFTSLAFPLCEMLIGLLRSLPTNAEFAPAKLHTAAILVSISRMTGNIVPVLPYLLDLIVMIPFGGSSSSSSSKDSKKGKSIINPTTLASGSSNLLDFSYILRGSTSLLSSSAYKNTVFYDSLHLILLLMESEAHTLAFPEVCYGACRQLRGIEKEWKRQLGGKFITPSSIKGGKKASKGQSKKDGPSANNVSRAARLSAICLKYVKAIKSMVVEMEKSGEWMGSERSTVSFSPVDSEKVAEFENEHFGKSPLSKYLEIQTELRSKGVRDAVFVDGSIHTPQQLQEEEKKREEERKEEEAKKKAE
ncbi:Nucleolar complex protein 2 like protein, partial [Aduncisulcus paluster]